MSKVQHKAYLVIPLEDIVEGYLDNNKPTMDDGFKSYEYIVKYDNGGEDRLSADVPTHIKIYL